MVAARGKKSKVSDRIEVEDSDHIDTELVLSIEKLQEVQDQLEKVRSKAELYKALDDYNVGDKVLLKIQRGNENLELQNDSILMAKASKAESPPLLARFLTTWAFSTMILCTICVCFYTLFSFVNLPLHVQDKDAHDINDGPRLQK